MEKIAIKATSYEHGAIFIKYLESLGGVNKLRLNGSCVNSYYFIGDDRIILVRPDRPAGYTEAFLPETEQNKPFDNFRAKAALMCLSFYEVEDCLRFEKAVRDADDLIKELNK